METTAQDQVFHDLEQRYLSLQNEHESVVVDLKGCRDQCERLKKMNEEMRLQLEAEEKLKSTYQFDLKQNETKMRDLSEESASFRDRYNRLSAEYERLRDDFQNQTSEMAALHGRLKDVQVLYSEAQSQELPLRFELSKVSREKELFEKQVAQLESELQQAQQNERERAAQSSEKIRSLELQLSSVTSDLESRNKEVGMLKEQAEQHQDKYLACTSKLHSLESELIVQQASSAKEVEALRRLSELNKGAFEDASSRVGELENVLASLESQHAAQLNELREVLHREVQSQLQQVDGERQHLASLNASLEARVKELEEMLEKSQAQSLGSSSLMAGDVMAGFKVTDMYDRVVALEREVLEERRQRKEAETVMTQILKEVEAKAPALAKQRKDYQRLVDYQSQLTAKLDAFAAENLQMKSEMRDMQDRLRGEAQQRGILQQQNADLSRQLQHLLRQSLVPGSAGGVHLVEDEGSEAQQVVSSHLVLFNSVEELQQRNAELLSVVRKLSNEGDSRASGAGVQALLDELNELKEARLRTEEMVAVLVQQRDMYKGMVDSGSGALPMITNHMSPAKSHGDSPRSSAGGQETELRLQHANEENRRLSEHLARVQDADRMLHETIDQLRGDLTNTRLDLVTAQTDARFHKERSGQLEESLRLSQQEVTTLMLRRAELDRTLEDALRQLRAKDEQVMSAQDAARQARDARQRLEVEVEVLRASEGRLVQQVNELRGDLQRNGALGEHLHRIEHGLHARAEQEKAQLQQERAAMEQSLKDAKRQLEETQLIDAQKIRSLEEDLRSTRAMLERREVEHEAASSALIREREILKASQERCELLDRQLQRASERLTSIRGAQLNDDVLERTLQERDVELQSLKAELLSAQEELQASRGHAEQYRKISQANDALLQTLQARAAAAEARFQEEGAELRAALDKARAEAAESRGQLGGLVREVEEMREKERAAASSHAEDLRRLHESAEASRAERDLAAAQVQVLRKDLEAAQGSAQSAFDQYERELQQHARAERELREERAASAELRNRLQHIEQQLQSQHSHVQRLEQQAQELKDAQLREREEEKQRMQLLQQTNDALHGQVQAYSLQLERAFEQRAAALSEAESAGGAAGGEGLSEQLQELKRSSGEMREVLKYMKREKEMLQAKLSLHESEGARLTAQLAALQKSLDQARAELKREAEGRADRGALRSEEEFARLLGELQNVHLLRESNAHLRGENEELLRKLKDAQQALEGERSARLPLEESMRKEAAQREALELETDQLRNDVAYWKQRLQLLVSRYHDVDPEEHRLLQQRLAERDQQLQDAQQALQAERDATAADRDRLLAEKDAAVAQRDQQLAERERGIAERDQQLAAHRASLESAEKNANMLREKLRSFKDKINELIKQLAAKDRDQQEREAEADRLRSRATELEKELQDARNSLAAQAFVSGGGAGGEALAALTQPLAPNPAPVPAPAPVATTPAPAAVPVSTPAPPAPAPAAAAVAATAGAPPPPSTPHPLLATAAAAAAAAVAGAPPPPSVPHPTAAQPTGKKRERPVPTPSAAAAAVPAAPAGAAAAPATEAPAGAAAAAPETSTSLQRMKQALMRKGGVKAAPAPAAAPATAAAATAGSTPTPAPPVPAAVEEEAPAKRARVHAEPQEQVEPALPQKGEEAVEASPAPSQPMEEERQEEKEEAAEGAKGEVTEAEEAAVAPAAPPAAAPAPVNPFANPFSASAPSLFSKPAAGAATGGLPGLFGFAKPVVPAAQSSPTKDAEEADAAAPPANPTPAFNPFANPVSATIPSPFTGLGLFGSSTAAPATAAPGVKSLFGGFGGAAAGGSLFGTPANAAANAATTAASPAAAGGLGMGLKGGNIFAAPAPAPAPAPAAAAAAEGDKKEPVEEDESESSAPAQDATAAAAAAVPVAGASAASDRLAMRAARFAAQQAQQAQGGRGRGRGRKGAAPATTPAAPPVEQRLPATEEEGEAVAGDSEEGQVE